MPTFFSGIGRLSTILALGLVIAAAAGRANADDPPAFVPTPATSGYTPAAGSYNSAGGDFGVTSAPASSPQAGCDPAGCDCNSNSAGCFGNPPPVWETCQPVALDVVCRVRGDCPAAGISRHWPHRDGGGKPNVRC